MNFEMPLSPSPSSTAFMLRWLRLVAALAIAAQATWLAFDHFRNLCATADDPYSLNNVVAKFAPLRAYLAGVDMVGYLASRTTGQNEQDEMEHGVARYALAPTLVCGHANKPLVITNFDTDQVLDALLNRGEFTVVARVGPGLAILKRVPK